MKFEKVAKTIAVSGISVAVGFVAGRFYSAQHNEASSMSALKLEVLTKAQELQTAAMALSFLDKDDSQSAKALLEGQLSSSLTVIHSLMPLELKRDELRIVNDAVIQGDDYAKKHSLK